MPRSRSKRRPWINTLDFPRATTKRSAGSVFGKKQLDVNFSTPQLGLALGISLKSVHIRETVLGPDHVAVAADLAALAALVQEQRRFGEAEKLY